MGVVAARPRLLTGTPVRRRNGLLLLLRVRAAENGPKRHSLRRSDLVAFEGKADIADLSRNVPALSGHSIRATNARFGWTLDRILSRTAFCTQRTLQTPAAVEG